MASTSIKKVKFDGIPSTMLGFSTTYTTFDNKAVLNKQGKKMVNDIINWLRQDYKENNEKIGTIKAQYFFEPFKVDLGVKLPDGSTRYDGSNMGETVYELVLQIFVPLTGMSFAATDVHTYRFNMKHGEFEHESTEIY
jgi:hypothetical protein